MKLHRNARSKTVLQRSDRDLLPHRAGSALRRRRQRRIVRVVLGLREQNVIERSDADSKHVNLSTLATNLSSAI